MTLEKLNEILGVAGFEIKDEPMPEGIDPHAKYYYRAVVYKNGESVCQFYCSSYQEDPRGYMNPYFLRSIITEGINGLMGKDRKKNMDKA